MPEQSIERYERTILVIKGRRRRCRGRLTEQTLGQGKSCEAVQCVSLD